MLNVAEPSRDGNHVAWEEALAAEAIHALWHRDLKRSQDSKAEVEASAADSVEASMEVIVAVVVVEVSAVDVEAVSEEEVVVTLATAVVTDSMAPMELLQDPVAAASTDEMVIETSLAGDLIREEAVISTIDTVEAIVTAADLVIVMVVVEQGVTWSPSVTAEKPEVMETEIGIVTVTATETGITIDLAMTTIENVGMMAVATKTHENFEDTEPAITRNI